MSTHKNINIICVVAVVFSIIVTVLFMNGELLGVEATDSTNGYETRLFDTSKVHTIDIVMDDWDNFIDTCENEEYVECAVVIDGESYKNVGIRAKGNTSLSTVSSMDSDRYSFKVEFDQYDNTKSYYGLDKLSLNNIIQDTTYMKDYLTYQMMAEFGVDAPLCSYVYITVNGEDWGLYLAVEGVEDAFLERNYGSDYGELYKPDSMSFGGGRGNGRDFDMEEFAAAQEEAGNETEITVMAEANSMQMPDKMERTDGTQRKQDMQMQGGAGGMGSSDVKLQYIDDDPDSYSNIFDNAKTDITDADKERLIESLKSLSSGENIEKIVNVEEVIRYFVVHNFVCNGDSYTGSMIHNYYLYEEDGQLSMIPWDYNLAFGTFQGSNATDEVNTPIDTPVSGGSSEDRPMIDWIFSSEEYTQMYHEYFEEFLQTVDFEEIIDTTKELIAPYVEKDPTKFYTYEEFESGTETLKEFCSLRKQSVEGQLSGTIASTTEGQSENSATLVDASHITLSDMGTMGAGMGGGFSDGRSQENIGQENQENIEEPSDMQMPENSQMPDGMQMPENSQMPDGMQMPENGQMSGGMQMPENGQMPDRTQMQENNQMSENSEEFSNNIPQSGSDGNIVMKVILVVISLVALLIGLIFVFRYKKY